MKRLSTLVFAGFSAIVSTAGHAATNTDYKGRCVFSKLQPARRIEYDGACTVTVGLIGSLAPNYRGPVIAYTLKAEGKPERNIRVWKGGIALVDGLPAKETTSKDPKSPIMFVSVEGDDVRFTPPPKDAF